MTIASLPKSKPEQTIKGFSIEKGKVLEIAFAQIDKQYGKEYNK